MQVPRPRLVALDSMNYWITSKRESLARAFSMVDVLLLNATEVKMYAQEPNLITAAQKILAEGPKALIIKRGEFGAMLITSGKELSESLFLTPAYPVTRVIDPTGAGDTFAAGFMGYLARSGELTLEALRRAGIDALSFDLMYGLPHQSLPDLLRSIDLAVALQPGRISLFGYAHVPWFKTHQRLIDEAALRALVAAN